MELTDKILAEDEAAVERQIVGAQAVLQYIKGQRAFLKSVAPVADPTPAPAKPKRKKK